MPQICKYPTDILPRRGDFLDDIECDPRTQEEVLFHAFDIANITNWGVYGRKISGFTLLVTGVLTTGRRANLIIEQIPIYFDIKLSIRNNHKEREDIFKLIRDRGDSNIEWEIVEKYPGVGFSQYKVQYLRIFFTSVWARKSALKKIKSSSIKYDTASDVEGSLIGSQIIKYEWTLGDWSLIQNYECKLDEKTGIYNMYIKDPNDFVAVCRPLSAEPALREVPKMPIYFHVPMDIEVNGNSDALPAVYNRDEVIFMLSGGIYRSDKPDVPMMSFTITHMDCMVDRYEEYMKSEERHEYMGEDRPDWTLILTKSEEDTLLAYAELLGNIQPEFRSQFNGYSFDDRFICERIKQYGKYGEFIRKLSIVPFSYTNYGKDHTDDEVFNRTFIETIIKLEAGTFNNSDNKRRLHYVGSIDVDIMSAMQKANPKDEFLASHALKAYLVRYRLPKKIDMSIADMNKYYNNKDGWGLLQSADYCTVDALSCHRIQNKVDLFKSYMTLAHLALCTVSDSALRAGGMKVKNVIYCFGKRMDVNYSENVIPEQIDGKYPGAVVFTPIRGRYTETPVIVLDYSSLYPSIMRAMWTSSETYIDVDRDPRLVQKLEEDGYDVFHFNPNWEYETSDEEGRATTVTVDKKVCYVRKTPDGKECMGVYPKCLEFLTNIRQMYKKKMSKAMNKVAELEKKENSENALFEAQLEERDFNQKQLAVKIISNTIYGKIGSTTFNLYNPYIASSITLMGQKLIKSASHIAEMKGYTRIYGDTDSIFLTPKVEWFRDLTHQETVKRCEKLAEEDLLPDILTDIRAVTRRDTNVINMELDKLLWPCLMLGKKKYGSIIYEGNKTPHDYISGLEYIKRGKSKLLIDLSKEIMKQVLDLKNKKSVLEMVLEVFKCGIDNVKREPVEYFVKRAKYRVGKEGFLSQFISRMKERAAHNSLLYQLPDPNSTFEYIITAPISNYFHNGNMRKSKISDKMEFEHVVRELGRPIDYIYYIEDVIGALARFICFEQQFNVSIDPRADGDVVDKKSNDNAKRFLKEQLNIFMEVNKVHHTIVKRQSKKVNSEHTKQYGEFIHYLFKAYDKDVEVNDIVNFIIGCTEDVPENDEDVDVKGMMNKKNGYVGLLHSREGKLKGIYSRYLRDIKTAMREEVQLNTFTKSNKISSSTLNICEAINELKYINSVLKYRSIDNCVSNADAIMNLLLKLFN